MDQKIQKRKRKTKIWPFVLVFIVTLILLLCGGVYLLFHSYYAKSSYKKDDEFKILYALPQETVEDEAKEDDNKRIETESTEDKNKTDKETDVARADGELTNEELTNGELTNGELTDGQNIAAETVDDVLVTMAAADEAVARQQASAALETVTEAPAAASANIYNLLLIGADRRDTSWYGNSDTMILVSVNSTTGKIYMTSFMRDLYAEIPGIGVRKLNSAYAQGAGPLLVQTLESNYNLNINNYAVVDFTSMASIIDICGGVDMELYQEEADYLNKTLGTSLTAGSMHLNGEQAVAYSRIRYVGQYDFERTSRQRRVLEQIFTKARSLSAPDLLSLVNAVLPYVTHNIEQGQLLSLLSNVPTWIHYSLQMDRVPYDGYYSYMGEIIVPDFSYTIGRLHETIYAAQ